MSVTHQYNSGEVTFVQVPVFDSFKDAQKAFPFPDLSELTKKEATCPEATTPVSP